MNEEDLDLMIDAVEKKEEAIGEKPSKEDLDALKKLWNGEITIDEYISL